MKVRVSFWALIAALPVALFAFVGNADNGVASSDAVKAVDFQHAADMSIATSSADDALNLEDGVSGDFHRRFRRFWGGYYGYPYYGNYGYPYYGSYGYPYYNNYYGYPYYNNYYGTGYGW